MMNCDPETGACLLPEVDADGIRRRPKLTGAAVHHVGDPMCSRCWDLSPVVVAVERFYEAEGIAFSIIMGGLQAGGGDPWNEQFRAFLRNEWSHTARSTGQPFDDNLLDRPFFDDDTEPACRAVVTVQMLPVKRGLPHTAPLSFFAALQQKFYVAGQDPKEIAFYDDICSALNIEVDVFREAFLSREAMIAVRRSFAQVRDWGVRSFPTLLIEKDGRMGLLANGYVSEDRAIAQLRDMFQPQAMST